MKEIQLTRGYVALVDDEDYERVMEAGPYANRSTRKPDGRRTTVSLHRFLLGVTNSKIHVDHENHNGLDNQKANIRVCTRSQNRANAVKRGGVSKYRGVHKAAGKWGAKITINGQKIWLGRFADELDAALAFDSAARAHFGEFANCNFPPKKPPVSVGSVISSDGTGDDRLSYV